VWCGGDLDINGISQKQTIVTLRASRRVYVDSARLRYAQSDRMTPILLFRT
jgi:hypothetical protein